jgi:hypothetical protein
MVLFGFVGTSGANVISWEQDDYGTVPANGNAGVVSVPNWTDSYPSNPTTNLPDNTGAATTLNITEQSPFGLTYQIQAAHPGQDANGTYNKEMLNGYLNGGPATWGPNPPNNGVVLNNIPYAQYDIYVYLSADVAGRTGFVTDGTVTVTGNGDATLSTFTPNGATTYDFSTIGPGEISGPNALFTQTTDTTGAYPAADYAVFHGLTGPNQTITAQMLVNDGWGGIAGFQIVSVPEPLSMSSLGLGALLMLKRRHARL